MNENFNEKIGLNVSEAANMLGISKNLMSELIKYPDFPCIKFKRRIVLTRKNYKTGLIKILEDFLFNIAFQWNLPYNREY